MLITCFLTDDDARLLPTARQRSSVMSSRLDWPWGSKAYGGAMTVNQAEPCRVCGSQVEVVAMLETPGAGDKDSAPEPVRRCTNPTCETNDRNDVSLDGRPTP